MVREAGSHPADPGSNLGHVKTRFTSGQSVHTCFWRVIQQRGLKEVLLDKVQKGYIGPCRARGPCAVRAPYKARGVTI
jgi:hypothetical protein